ALVGVQGGAARLQLAQVPVAVDDEIARGAPGVVQDLLDAGQAPGCEHVQRAGVRIDLSLQQGEQRGLAGAVLADDADAFSGMDDEFGVFQQDLDAAPRGQAGGADHEASCARRSSRIWPVVAAVSSQIGSSSGKAASKCPRWW